MTMGKLAEKYSINRETIRFYERKGLFPQPMRSSSGYRLYDSNAEKTLSFLLRAKDLGFTLQEIKALLALRVANTEKCSLVKSQAHSKIEQIDAKLDFLKKMRKSLEILVATCENKSKTSGCPIIENLEN